MEYCYELGHYYENERGIDIFKMLGIFSTREKAERALIMYSKKPVSQPPTSTRHLSM